MDRATNAAAGALIGTGAGAAAGLALAGSITASAGAVLAGSGALASAVSAGGLGAGISYISNNISRGIGSSSAAQAAAEKMRQVSEKGRAGEAASGIIKNTEKILSLTKTAHYRIPDGLDMEEKILSEVKNYAGTLSYTKQLKDFVMWSQANGYEMHLYTNARLSDSLQAIVDSGCIQVFPLN